MGSQNTRDDDLLLSIRGLKTHFRTNQGTVRAVDTVNMDIEVGETVGLVGESGSGKSVTAHSILQLIEDPGEIVDGEILLDGTDLTDQPESTLREIRGNRISMIFQSPMTALNPTMTVGRQVGRVLYLHREEYDRKGRKGLGPEAREEVLRLFQEVELPDPEQRLSQYPHQLSGGMKQRVLIAMAIACEPDLLIADEPTTALDVTVESKIFDLITDLVEERDISLLLITHDLGVVAHTCETVNIMYAGEIIETGSVREIFHDPKHPYTRELLRSLPAATELGEELHTIGGTVPDPINLPAGCRFAPRCPEAFDDCETIHPDTREFDGRSVRCLLYEKDGSLIDDNDPDHREVSPEEGHADD